MAANPHIDTDREHLQVLFALGLLDDMDSWSLFQAQEARFNAVDDTVSLEQWRQYVVPADRFAGADAVQGLERQAFRNWMNVQGKRLKALPQRPKPRI